MSSPKKLDRNTRQHCFFCPDGCFVKWTIPLHTHFRRGGCNHSRFKLLSVSLINSDSYRNSTTMPQTETYVVLLFIEYFSGNRGSTRSRRLCACNLGNTPSTSVKPLKIFLFPLLIELLLPFGNNCCWWSIQNGSFSFYFSLALIRLVLGNRMNMECISGYLHKQLILWSIRVALLTIITHWSNSGQWLIPWIINFPVTIRVKNITVGKLILFFLIKKLINFATWAQKIRSI